MHNQAQVLPAPEPIPELDAHDPRRYQMNMDWVWSSKHNPGLRKCATVRATVTVTDPEEYGRRFHQWARHLHGPGPDEVFVHGGWGCRLMPAQPGTTVMLFWSAGQDVAESLDYGIQWFSGAVLKYLPDAAVVWEELPLTQDPEGIDPFVK